ncbi:GNAT family N-acetyltransferase [Ferrovibrio sp.]|uniref:GNAT family N-acetyltransferase n=1 Tax=Ferrovibrio sp. TaxID=1917215 RepID=UPI000CBD737E|nr:GNAT family N-acetyltransferase [Ferrovibrio sp.]PJI40132.1 MAG: GNAT family N-acetyltransferase [Ferrovibrio sp.]
MKFRLATEADLPEIVRLLADDHLGGSRERYTDPLPPEYGIAFAGLRKIGAEVILAEDESGKVIGCLQLLVLPGLGSLGKQRAQIEAVRIESSLRGKGLGSDLIRHAIARAKQKGCKMVQLTSDNSRQGAHRLYERLGFKASHVGMKLALD